MALRFSNSSSRGAAAAVLAMTLLAGGARTLAGQQPTPPQAGAQKPAAGAQKPVDPRTTILQRLKRLDAKRDTARKDSAAVADSAAEAAPTSTAARPGAPVTTSLPIEEDSIMKALSSLNGFTVTEYMGKSAHFDSDTGKLVLTGPAKVAQGAQAMSADSTLTYNQNTQIACGFGKPVLTGAGQSEPVSSDQVCYDVERRVGVAFGARTKFQEGSTAWFIDGHKVYLSGSENVFGRDAEFTDCDLTQPHYHFTARELKVVKGKVIVARDVTLSFADVPVFWLPFMLQPLEKGRSSGLLMPRFDLNDVARTNANYQRRIQNIGFYWAMNDNLGSLFSLDWFSNNYTAVHGAFDYSFRRQFLNGGLELRRYWRTAGSKELALNSSNSWRPDERTNIQVNASYATSSQFVRDQSFDPRELNRSIDSNLALQRRFNWGSFDVSGRRRQYLSNDRVTMTLPSVSFSPMPLSFFKRSDGSSLLTWNGGGNFTVDRDDAGDPVLSPDPSSRNKNGSLNSSINLGKFSWAQSMSFTDASSLLRPQFTRPKTTGTGIDTVPSIAPQAKGQVSWSTSLSYQQRLFGTSSLTPNLSITGQSMSIDTGDVHTGMIAAPNRLNFGVGTQVDVYGFWPGAGPFSRIRHKLSPSFGYSYSPAIDSTRLTSAQRLLFGGASSRENNVLTIGLNQTFEAKYKATAKDDSAAAVQDTATSQEGEPRRLPQARKVVLLAINTSSVAYDFGPDPITNRRVGFRAPSISNTIRSDLIPGLQFNITHDIFRYDSAGTSGPRHFSPYLTNASTAFSLDDKSWIFRVLGLTSRPGSRPGEEAQRAQQPDTTRTTAGERANEGIGQSIVGSGAVRRTEENNGPIGSWRAQFTYDLSRQRPSGLPHNNPGTFGGCSPVFGGCGGYGGTQQMLRGNLGFQPTKAWSVNWQTGYSFSEHTFADHVLTLTRDLHDWEAHFDFVKAQNGNFSFQFRVNLKAQPDLKFDYSQRGGDAYRNINNLPSF